MFLNRDFFLHGKLLAREVTIFQEIFKSLNSLSTMQIVQKANQSPVCLTKRTTLPESKDFFIISIVYAKSL